jgi:hypothetical protein
MEGKSNIFQRMLQDLKGRKLKTNIGDSDSNLCSSPGLTHFRWVLITLDQQEPAMKGVNLNQYELATKELRVISVEFLFRMV